MFDGVTGVRADRVLRQLGAIDSLILKARSEIRPPISLRFRSCDVCTEASSLNLAFSWTLSSDQNLGVEMGW